MYSWYQIDNKLTPCSTVDSLNEIDIEHILNHSWHGVGLLLAKCAINTYKCVNIRSNLHILFYVRCVVSWLINQIDRFKSRVKAWFDESWGYFKEVLFFILFKAKNSNKAVSKNIRQIIPHVCTQTRNEPLSNLS